MGRTSGRAVRTFRPRSDADEELPGIRRDCKAFKIVNGKLCVNKDEDVYKTWVKDTPGHIKDADANWPRIRDTKAKDL